MVNKLSEAQVQFLTYLVGLLLLFLTIATIKIAVDLQKFKGSMPETYVRLERYGTDENQTRCALKRIESKLDALIMKPRLKDDNDGP